MEPLKIKVAFQGGGAKLMPMLAVADAIHTLAYKRHEIEISEVAGTSAGAIVAAIIANRVNPKEFAEILCKNGGQYIKSLSSGSYFVEPSSKLDYVRNAREVIFSELNKIGPISNFNYAQKFIRSKPLGNSSAIREALAETFEHCEPPILRERRIAECPIPIKIIVANLREAKKEIRSQDGDGNSYLLDEIVHSCALPIFFRTKNSLVNEGIPYVDGGLFNNLPIDDLIDKSGEIEQNIVAVTFNTSESSGKVKSCISYVLHLFFSSIDHSVARSSNLLETGDLLSIKTNLGTLDFEEALEQGPESETYKKHKEDAIEWFEKYIERKN